MSLQKYPYADAVRTAIRHLPVVLENVGYADSAGLGDKGDQLHFSADAEKIFGVRYARAMLLLQAQPASAAGARPKE